MKNKLVIYMSILFFISVFSGIYSCLYAEEKQNNKESLVLENDSLKITLDSYSGCFTVLEKISGQVWSPDPWEHAAGLLTLNSKGKKEVINISQGSKIEISKIDNNSVRISFQNPAFEDGTIANGVSITSDMILDPIKSQLTLKIIECKSGPFGLINLRYPARHFSLRTDIDRGAGVIPSWQGVICPSYIFPMTGGRFCQWDDAVYDRRSIGSLRMYAFEAGLSMPWWGTYNEKTAVVGILNKEPDANLNYNINNNGQYLFDPKQKMSNFSRILFLDPEWLFTNPTVEHEITYYFIPGGNYVDMAKKYREVAKDRGYFVSLKEKAERNANVKKLAGALYLGVYGGYPHYVNMPGMAFTFDRLKNIIKDVHDNLKVENAFIHAWGTFSNYAPNNWPISEALGGKEKLKEAVSYATENGYLYSSYHAVSPRLEHDPDFNLDLVPDNMVGQSRWARVDSRYFKSLVERNLPNEVTALGQNADVTDILFIGRPDPGRIALAEYLRTTNLVLGTERGNEQYIPYFDLFEGMTYFYCALEGVQLATISHKAPLFNLVYHDAIANYGKIQDPDNDITFNGDFRTKSLRNILFGNGSMIFFAPYEYEGMRVMIKTADELVAPVHRETFYDELVKHEYLSADFQVQRSKFAGGTEITVNLGPVDQQIQDGTVIPAYGYKIKFKDNTLKSGSFIYSLSSN